MDFKNVMVICFLIAIFSCREKGQLGNSKLFSKPIIEIVDKFSRSSKKKNAKIRFLTLYKTSACEMSFTIATWNKITLSKSTEVSDLVLYDGCVYLIFNYYMKTTDEKFVDLKSNEKLLNSFGIKISEKDNFPHFVEDRCLVTIKTDTTIIDRINIFYESDCYKPLVSSPKIYWKDKKDLIIKK